jgi:hypothetical protein
VSRNRDLAFGLLGATVALVFAGKVLFPDAGLYRDVFSPLVLLRLGGIAKLLFLGLAWLFAWRTARSLDPDNPARRPWRLFAFGLLGFLGGQTVLSAYQVVGGVSPYPSPGDAFFLAGYPLLIFACFSFIRAYSVTGLPVGSRREHVALALAAAALFLVTGYRLLAPVLASDAPPIERALTAGYPALDFVLLIPILILLRITAPFHGGRVFRAWGMLLAGMIFQSAGDLFYAWFAVMGQTGLEPLVDATFVLAYALLAGGTLEHHRLLTD